MRFPSILAAVLFLSISSCQSTGSSQAFKPAGYEGAGPCTNAGGCEDRFKLINDLMLPIYRSHALAVPHNDISRAVVVIHGNSRNGDTYFDNMMDAAVQAKAQWHTLVVAPNFYIGSDQFIRKPGAVYWDRSNSWKKGHKSTKDYDHRISSFAAVDLLLARLADRALFPNLKTIVIAGHSAGGQFVQRYSLGHRPNAAHENIHLRFIVANPGRYFYFNEYRIKAGYRGGFEIPRHVEDCAYNRYEYGMDRRNAYMSQGSPRMMIDRYRTRDVVLLVGERDNDTDARGLNTNCKSMLQGRHRLERAVIFKKHLDTFFSPHNTRLFVIPRVGHSNRGMFHSARGIKLLFH